MKDKITIDKSIILNIVKNFEGAYDFLPDDLKNDDEIRDAVTAAEQRMLKLLITFPF